MINCIIETVDSAGINQRVFILPREVSLITCCLYGEVSRGHINQIPDNLINKDKANAWSRTRNEERIREFR
ncbi:MAG: hypothetical protein ACJAUV_001598 [Flavobacteriales bacterium]|jgi:hypothetical protein